MIGSNDLLIDAHALAENITLVTGNEKEFKRVNGWRGIVGTHTLHSSRNWQRVDEVWLNPENEIHKPTRAEKKAA